MDNGGNSLQIEAGANECTPCPSNAPYTLSDGATSCVECPSNYFKFDTGTGSFTCEPCSDPCGEDQYEISQCTDVSDRVCETCDMDKRPECEAGSRPQPCGPSYGGCIECLNSKPEKAYWVNPIDGFYCGWKCEKGFYQTVFNCEPCTDWSDKCDVGYAPSECHSMFDSTCFECQNSTKPLVNAEWIKNTCNWQCSGGRVAKKLSSGGFFCSF